MKYELVCADIDGTLLDDEKKVLPRVKESLAAAAKKGLRIALASGRMPFAIEIIEKELELECIKICSAGSYILMGESCVDSQCLPNAAMREIYEKIAKKHGIPLWIFQEKDWFVTGIDKYVEKEIEIISHEPKLANMEELAKRLEDEGKQPNKLLLAADAETIQTIYQEMKGLQGVDMACSSPEYLEIFPKGVDKGTALLAVCRELGISTQQVIAFGDQELDLPLIEAAGTGIAMGNAIDELKEKADFVTKTNNEAGIAYALDRYLGEVGLW